MHTIFIFKYEYHMILYIKYLPFVEHGYMRGKKKIDSIAAERMESASESKTYSHLTLMDLIIETVSKCSDEIDDGVQLQVQMMMFEYDWMADWMNSVVLHEI